MSVHNLESKMKKRFSHICINKESTHKVIEIGLKYNPDPWKKYGDTIDQIFDSIVFELGWDIRSQSPKELFGGLMYSFPSTIVLYTKMFDQRTRTYSDDVVECTLLYDPPGNLQSRNIFPETQSFYVEDNGNFFSR